MRILIIVDMQNDFVQGALGAPEAQAIVPKVADKIRNAPEDTYIIYTRDTHGNDYLYTREGENLPVEHCIFETEGWEIISELLAPFAELGIEPRIINKSTFGSIELMHEIEYCMAMEDCHNEKFVEIEFCGLVSDICVISNVILTKAHFPEANIKVDSSCCAGSTPLAHEQAIAVMKSCQIEVV